MLARTGKTPITLCVNPRLVLSIFMSVIVAPLLGAGGLVYHSLYRSQQQVQNLIQENQRLTEQAQNILEQVEVLEAEINVLQDRAGIPPAGIPEMSSTGQGGEGAQVTAEMLLTTARQRIPGLFFSLKESVQPALENMLVREEARPRGIPIQAPVRTSSKFGLRRNPFGRGYELHKGLDFVAPYGSPIQVTAAGVVVKAELSGGYGYHVVVDHGFGLRTLYGHLSKLAVQTGDRLERDRIVGFLGNTGRSSGPHLHYEVRVNNIPVDPEKYLH